MSFVAFALFALQHGSALVGRYATLLISTVLPFWQISIVLLVITAAAFSFSQFRRAITFPEQPIFDLLGTLSCAIKCLIESFGGAAISSCVSIWPISSRCIGRSD